MSLQRLKDLSEEVEDLQKKRKLLEHTLKLLNEGRTGMSLFMGWDIAGTIHRDETLALISHEDLLPHARNLLQRRFHAIKERLSEIEEAASKL